jgi:putative sterol carrier protein
MCTFFLSSCLCRTCIFVNRDTQEYSTANVLDTSTGIALYRSCNTTFTYVGLLVPLPRLHQRLLHTSEITKSRYVTIFQASEHRFNGSIQQVSTGRMQHEVKPIPVYIWVDTDVFTGITNMTIQSQLLTQNHVTVAMNEAVQQYPTVRKKVNAVIQFNIGNDGDDDVDNNQNQSSSIVINAKMEQKELGSGSDEREIKDPDLVLRTNLVVLQNLLQKVTTPQKEFMKGQIRIIKGKLSLAMKLSYLLEATRKVLLIQHSKSKL